MGRNTHRPEMHRNAPVKESVRCATTAAITLATGLENGDSIDGQTLATGDRVLVKDQGSAENGIYIVAASGAPSRAYDMDTGAEVMGCLVYVRQGTANGGKVFRNTNTSVPTLGVTTLTFAVISGAAPGGGSVFYNVADYGATGDGTTDDTSAINAAIAAADATSGGTIYFPPGTYKITSTLSCTGGDYHFLGSGSRYGPTRIAQATANTTAISFAPAAGTANRTKASKVENLVVSGPGAASSGAGISATNDLHVEHCFVYGFYDGINLNTASYYSLIHASTFTDCDRAGVYLDQTNNTVIDSCRFTGLFSGGSAPIGTLKYGIYMYSPSPRGLNNRVISSSIEYFTDHGIYVDGGRGQEFIGCYFETQQSGYGFSHLYLGPTSRTVSATRVASCYFQGDGTAGFDAIKCGYVDGLLLETNYFGINASIINATTANTANVVEIGDIYNPSGTTTWPASYYELDPANPPIDTGDSAGGDLSGTYPNPGVSAVNGVAVSGTPSTGQIITATGTSTATWQDPASTGGGGEILISDSPSTPLVFADLIQNEAQNDLVYAD